MSLALWDSTLSVQVDELARLALAAGANAADVQAIKNRALA